MKPQAVITRDLSSGRIHLRTRYYSPGPLQSYEGCNLTLHEAGAYEQLAVVPDDIDPGALCQRCFPSVKEERLMPRKTTDLEDLDETRQSPSATGLLMEPPPDDADLEPLFEDDEDEDEVPDDPEADEETEA